LNAEEFLTYHVPDQLREDEEASLKLCVEARLFRQATSCIRKKQHLTMYVTKDEPMMLRLAISNSDKDNKSVLGVPLHDYSKMSQIDRNPDSPCEYRRKLPNATCVAAELAKACKAGSTKGGQVRISAQESGVRFESVQGIEREYFFGRWNSDDEVLFQKSYVGKGVVDTISRCCSMSTNAKIYCEGMKPVCCVLNCGPLGTLSIYLVS
jgi:hypothetical protein